MPPLQGRTRLQIREAVGYSIRAMEMMTAAAADSTGATFITDHLRGGSNNHNGKWWVGTDSTHTGVYSNVLDSALATTGRTTITLYPVVAAVAAGNTAELWDMQFNPKMVEEFINQAIIEVTGRVYDPEESLALHGDGRQMRFDIPTEFVMLNGIYRRVSVESVQIETATVAWDESVDSDVTASQDTKDYKKSPGSFKMVVAVGAAAADILATKAITSLDLSGYDYVEFWMKSTVAQAAGGLSVLLGHVASCASVRETLSVPALVADTWTYCRVALANPELDTAIISVGVKFNTDIGAHVLWINDIKAVNDASAEWVRLEPRSWRVNQEARTVDFTSAPSYSLLKLTGGDKPALLSADATACEIDDQYVIARATELTLLSSGGGPSTDPDALRSLAGYWGNRAEEAKRSLPFLQGVRVVS